MAKGIYKALPNAEITSVLWLMAVKEQLVLSLVQIKENYMKQLLQDQIRKSNCKLGIIKIATQKKPQSLKWPKQAESVISLIVAARQLQSQCN